jgi:toxin YoeB
MNTRGSKKFDDDYAWFFRHNRLFLDKIKKLISDIRQHPESGIGKPELLKYREGEFWSRRIDKKHRLVYHVKDEMITFVSCRGHYDD